MIPRSFINGLIERVDIVDVIGPSVQLRKAGGNHIGLCPFHEEKTPSFHVYADGHYHCFGCGAHGTSLGYLMDRDGLSFPEAVEALAAVAGLEVPREHADKPRADPALYDVLKAADKWFRGRLRDASEAAAAHAYLRGRGITGVIARDFHIGLAPPGWERLKTALAAFGEHRLVSAGLLIRNDAGRTYDRFRGRIVFPIHDTRGRVIGFGGRIFDAGDGAAKPDHGGEPKYLNSPETEVFHKGRELYGLFEARRAHRRLDSVVVVEGYMDVVALAQHGVDNAVATLGTAIGQAHFEKLYRFTDLIVCCFDGDDAGRGAAWKAVDAAFPVLSAGRELRFVFLPEGEDPDTLVRDRGSEHLRELIQAATPAGEYFLERLRGGLDLSQVDARAILCELALPHLGRLPAGALRSMLIGALAKLGDTDAAVLEGRLPTAQATADGPQTVPRATAEEPPSKLAERLLHCLVHCPGLVGAMAAADRDRLLAAATEAGGLLAEALGYLAAEPEADTATLLGRFVGDAAHAQLGGLVQRPLLLTDAELANEFADGVQSYLRERARAAHLALYRDVQERGSVEDLQRYWEARRGAPGTDT